MSFLAGPSLARRTLFIGAYRTPSNTIQEYKQVPLFLRCGSTVTSAWLVPDDKDNDSSLIMFCHGNYNTALSSSSLLQIQSKFSKSTIVGLEYRGYGSNNMRPSVKYLGQDVADQMKQVINKTRPKKIMVYGFSIGGAAILAAYKCLQKNSTLKQTLNKAKFVIDSSFASSLDCIPRPFRALAVIFSFGLCVIDSKQAMKTLASNTSNILVLGSSKDNIVPFWSTQILARVAKKSCIDTKTPHCILGVQWVEW